MKTQTKIQTSPTIFHKITECLIYFFAIKVKYVLFGSKECTKELKVDSKTSKNEISP